MAEDRALEVAERGAWIDAELLGERPPRRTLGLERLLLPAAAVEGEDELLAQPLSVGCSATSASSSATSAAWCPSASSTSPRSSIASTRRSASGRRRRSATGSPREVGERRTRPERERLVDRGRGVLRPSGCECAARPADQFLEAVEVELARLDAQPVGRPARLDAVRAEHAAQSVDVHLERLHRRAGHRLAPDGVRERVARHDLVAAQQQRSQDGALLRGAERKRLAALERLDRPEHAELRGDS